MPEALAWAVVAYAIWLATLGAFLPGDLAVAALCALLAGAAATAARWAVGESWGFRAGWFRVLLALPVVMVSDAWQVLAAPWRPASWRPGGDGGGRFHVVPTPSAGPGPRARGRRAFSVMVVSCTPGTYVLDVDPDTGDMLVHSLAPRGPRLERWVQR